MARHQAAMKTCRIVVNTPSSFGGIGDLYNFKLAPSLTLGCGSWGGNSVSENVGVKHLINIKTVAERRENMLWFRTPEKVFFKKGCMPVALEELKTEYARKKAFIVTDSFLYQNGYTKPLTDRLDELGIQYAVFADVAPDPTLACAREGVKQINSFQPDVIIALGGGSPMDAAKAIALMVANLKEVESSLYEAREFQALPVAEVPTTAGTGSEATPYAILTIHARRTKQSISYRIYPALALLDSKYLKTESIDTLVNTTVDALAHLIESYLNTNANSYNRMYSEKGLRLFAEMKDDLLQCRRFGGEPRQTLSDEVFDKLMQMSATAGMAITHTSTSLQHGLSYAVTYELGVPHGKAVGIFLPGFLTFYQEKEDVRAVLRQMCFASVDDFTEYMDELLGKVEISDDLWKKDVEMIMGNQAKLKNYPFTMDEETLYKFRR